jgi:hypothetical protein
MNQIRRNPFLALITAAALSLALLGCGSGGGYGKPNTPQPMPPAYPPGGNSGAGR